MKQHRRMVFPSAAALRVINLISDYNKKGQLEHELCELQPSYNGANEIKKSGKR
jgi:hypothetical protein